MLVMACCSQAKASSILKMKNGKKIFRPLDANGTTYVDEHYTKAYLRHLFISASF